MFSCERNDADGMLLTERDVQLLLFDLPQSCISRKSYDAPPVCHSLCFISGVTRMHVEVQCVSYILLQHERSKVGRHCSGRVRRLGPAH